MSGPDWSTLPDHVLHTIFRYICWSERPILELVCRKFYDLVTYDCDHQCVCMTTCSCQIDQFFAGLEVKQTVKPVRFRHLYLANATPSTLTILSNRYVSAKVMALDFNNASVNANVLHAMQVGLSNLTFLHVEHAIVVDIPSTNVRSAFATSFPRLVSLHWDMANWFPTRLPGSLKWLILSHVHFDTRFDEILADCTQLENLMYIDCEASEPANLPYLPALRQLIFLHEDVADIEHGTASELLAGGGKNCPALDMLVLCTLQTPLELDNIPQLNNLTDLLVTVVGVDDILNFLNRCNPDMVKLRVVVIIAEQMVEPLVNRFQHLTVLQLHIFDAKFGDTALRTCLALPELSELDLKFHHLPRHLSISGLAHAYETFSRCCLIFVENIPRSNMENALLGLVNECQHVSESPRPRISRKSDLELRARILLEEIPDDWYVLSSKLMAHHIQVEFVNEEDLLMTNFRSTFNIAPYYS